MRRPAPADEFTQCSIAIGSTAFMRVLGYKPGTSQHRRPLGAAQTERTLRQSPVMTARTATATGSLDTSTRLLRRSRRMPHARRWSLAVGKLELQDGGGGTDELLRADAFTAAAANAAPTESRSTTSHRRERRRQCRGRHPVDHRSGCGWDVHLHPGRRHGVCRQRRLRHPRQQPARTTSFNSRPTAPTTSGSGPPMPAASSTRRPLTITVTNVNETPTLNRARRPVHRSRTPAPMPRSAPCRPPIRMRVTRSPTPWSPARGLPTTPPSTPRQQPARQRLVQLRGRQLLRRPHPDHRCRRPLLRGGLHTRSPTVNETPDANDDGATVAEDSGANTIDVLANDEELTATT